MMDIFIQASQFFLSLSILIILHEMGHFIPAKLFKTRVEKFYLFFDPWFSLFKFKKGDTEYGMGWLPLGGYVKISGMIDESMDKEQMKLPPQPWEFRSKPTWQRLIIMVGGVTVNVILGALIYIMILFVWGEKYLPAENVKYGIHCDSLALEVGLRNGDKILSIDGEPVTRFDKITMNIILDKAKTIEVMRDDTLPVTVHIPEVFFSKIIKSRKSFITPSYPCEIDSVLPGDHAEKAGLLKGDKIIEVAGMATPSFQSVVEGLSKNKGMKINISIIRNGSIEVVPIEVSIKGKLGFGTKTIDKYLTFETNKFTLAESVPAGIRKGLDTFDDYIKNMKLLFTTDDAYESLGGFITIGSIFSPVWDWQHFWNITAFLSIVLAVMNILPIPALDGGHVMFLFYEIITGRKPNEKFMEYAQYAGMIMLLCLLVLANGNDILRLLGR